MPQKPQGSAFVAATKTVSAEVYVFDSSKVEAEGTAAAAAADDDDAVCRPDLRLTGVTGSHSLPGVWTRGVLAALRTTAIAAVHI